MNTKTAPKEAEKITEINIEAIKNIESYVDNLNQNEENYKVITNTPNHSFTNIQCQINSILSLVIECCFCDTNHLDKVDMGYALEVARTKLSQLPVEFVDKLLIKESYNTEDFKNLNKL